MSYIFHEAEYKLSMTITLIKFISMKITLIARMSTKFTKLDYSACSLVISHMVLGTC